MTRYPPWGMLGPAAIAWWALRTQTASVRVEGLENVPARGRCMLVARHFHHLLDGSVLVRRVPRPVHIVVGLDWTADAHATALDGTRVPRGGVSDRAAPGDARRTAGLRAQRTRALHARRAYARPASLLRAGRVVLVFPEGYPNVDPAFARKAR